MKTLQLYSRQMKNMDFCCKAIAPEIWCAFLYSRKLLNMQITWAS